MLWNVPQLVINIMISISTKVALARLKKDFVLTSNRFFFFLLFEFYSSIEMVPRVSTLITSLLRGKK